MTTLGDIKMCDLLKDVKFSHRFNAYFSDQRTIITFILSSFHFEVNDLRVFLNTLDGYMGKTPFSTFYLRFLKNQSLQSFCLALFKMKTYNWDDVIVKYLEDVLHMPIYNEFNEIYNEFLTELWKGVYIPENIHRLMLNTRLIECSTFREMYDILDEYIYNYEGLIE